MQLGLAINRLVTRTRDRHLFFLGGERRLRARFSIGTPRYASASAGSGSPHVLDRTSSSRPAASVHGTTISDMRVLGISGVYHDSAAALVRDGEIVCAAQEERFTRRKHDPSLPVDAIEYCLAKSTSGLTISISSSSTTSPLRVPAPLETYLALRLQGWGSFSRAFPVWVEQES